MGAASAGGRARGGRCVFLATFARCVHAAGPAPFGQLVLGELVDSGVGFGVVGRRRPGWAPLEVVLVLGGVAGDHALTRESLHGLIADDAGPFKGAGENGSTRPVRRGIARDDVLIRVMRVRDAHPRDRTRNRRESEGASTGLPAWLPVRDSPARPAAGPSRQRFGLAMPTIRESFSSILLLVAAHGVAAHQANPCASRPRTFVHRR